jgi:hypothetical protein
VTGPDTRTCPATVHKMYWNDNIKGAEKLRRKGVDEMIMLKRTLQKYVFKM